MELERFGKRKIKWFKKIVRKSWFTRLPLETDCVRDFDLTVRTVVHRALLRFPPEQVLPFRPLSQSGEKLSLHAHMS